MKAAPAAAIVLLVFVLLTWLSLRAVNPDAEMFDQAIGELDRFAMIENALYRDVFSARAGTLRNYDPLVRELNVLHASVERLRETAARDAEMTAAVEQLSTSIDHQEMLVEQFKSVNALLHNSLALFARLSVSLASSQMGPAVNAAAAAMLSLTLDPSSTAASDVRDRLDELAKYAHPVDDDSVGALVLHGRLLHDLLPAADDTLKAMRALPRSRDQNAFRAILVARKNDARFAARRFRWLLYGTSLLLLGFLVHVGFRLRSRANALQRRASFEHALAGISMRFINAQPHDIDAEIDRAVAVMAACIGCDRGYFVMNGPAPRRHLWCRPGMNFPPGWPDCAYEFAARFADPVDGIVQVPSVGRLPPGEYRDACLAFELGGWACAANLDKDGARATLGFDAIGRPCQITASGELSLLRMALDTILYAVGRHAMETERARLESRLQQARRLEILGTFTSGVAHSFNNILGGILGHSEVIEERLGAGGSLQHNLGAIRRGAERARDLVDQILAFGRRRDGHRHPVRVRALFGEASSLLNVSLPAGVDLSMRASADAVVAGEPAQLQQVIFNLCNNAAQAMENAGRIAVDAEVHDIVGIRSFSHGELRTGKYVCLSIQDTGRGMDRATLARIFEPFFTTRPTGNGLGLSTVREIVREHGGAIGVRSTPGDGSRFEVWLPCMMPNDHELEIEVKPLPLGRGESVLLVAEHDARLLRDEEVLAALGYEPLGFASAEAALAACRANPDRIDAIIVGHAGSTISSLQLAAALHAVAPDLPIVLATRSPGEIGTDSLLGVGIADVVHWPIVAAEIANALHHGLLQIRHDAPGTAVAHNARSLVH